ncbi:MAG: site-2 protease family protein [Frankiaceae bacterium]|nr:site-2 protease family protein [Frankiaceae bacterium]
MLRALGDPLSFLILLVSFVVAVVVHGWVQCVVADRTGDRRPRQEQRLTPDPRRHVDPFGAIAGAIAGFGWSRPLEPAFRAGRGALLATFLSGAAANLLLAVGGLVAFRAVSGLSVPAASATALQDGVEGLPAGQIALLLFGLMNLYVGFLSLVPLPPLDGGRLLFALAPRTSGWQKAQYHLVEQNIGLVAVLVLLLLPLGGPQALLPTVLDDLVSPLVRLVTGG